MHIYSLVVDMRDIAPLKINETLCHMRKYGGSVYVAASTRPLGMKRQRRKIYSSGGASQNTGALPPVRCPVSRLFFSLASPTVAASAYPIFTLGAESAQNILCET